MSFQSWGYLALLAAAGIAVRSTGAKRRGLTLALLIAAGLIFALRGGGLWVLLIGVLVTLAGLYIARRLGSRALIAAAVFHIAVLLLFKLAPPFPMPAGLSFFTFAQLFILRRAGQGRLALSAQPGTAALELGALSLFFPTLLSGPILKPEDFLPQTRGESAFHVSAADAAAAVRAIVQGFSKKLLLADPLGTLVSAGWENLAALNTPGALLVSLCFTLQLFLDFSAYCDIAWGSARLLGVHIPENFRAPYRALSVTDFWRRWHITLTDFLRENVYFPLGGSRKGPRRAMLNILITFLVSGFWHGTGWTFLLWGALHGLAQIVERAWGEKREHLPRALRFALTFGFVSFAWVFFRAPSVGAALALLGRVFTGGFGPIPAFLTAQVYPLEGEALRGLLGRELPLVRLAALLGISLFVAFAPAPDREKAPGRYDFALYAALAVFSLCSMGAVQHFIYANF